MLTAQELQQGLSQFIGTENFYDANLKFNYTDGVRWLAQNAECFWLLTLISSYQYQLKTIEGADDFQLWILKKTGEFSAVAECWDDEPCSDGKPLVSQQIEFTDFPLEQIKFFLSCGVLMLPTEW